MAEKELQHKNQQLDEDGLIICRCEEVDEETIVGAIAEGALTLADIKRRTRAGMGLCQGRSCRRLVSRIIAQETGQALAAVSPATFRPPVRPTPLGALAVGEEDEFDGR